MARLEVQAAAPAYQWWPAALDNDGPGDIVASSATELKYESNSGFVVTLSGTGFDFSGGVASTGTVNQLTVRDSTDTTVLITITGLAHSLPGLYYTLCGDDDSAPNPYGALEQLLAGSDTILGSNGSDQIGAYSPGNDNVNSLGGNDIVAGDAGNDVLNGGAGYDVVSYYYSLYDTTSFRGINLDAATRVVTDCWGGRDTIVNFETFEGSRFNDIMKGSNNSGYDEEFRPLGGSDLIDGRGGWDNVIYSYDSHHGGNGRIRANLVTGKITDGWGGTDTVKNVEGVFGTARNDTFIGNNNNNEFQGLAGVDSFNGGGGLDYLGFWMNDFSGGLHGVNVNLSRQSGQVLDDGYGNRENAVSMEHVFGTAFGDTITGSNVANTLHGNGGNDRLSGLGGNDFVDGDDGNDVIDGGTGNDRLLGGAGIDTLSYASATSRVVASLAKTGAQSTGGGGTDSASGFENLTGGAGADILTGNALANLLVGSRGNDTLSGAAGNDTLSGGTGADLMKGGAGNDVYVVDNAADVVDESAAGSNGIDTVISSISFSLVAGLHVKGAVENLTLTGAGAINGTGNALANIITGNNAANVLSGGDGNDVIKGLGGADTIDGGNGIDMADYGDKTGGVTVALLGTALATVFVNGVAEDHIWQIENITGGSGNDTLTGDNDANVLAGGAGADTLIGGKGADILAIADLDAGETIDGTTEAATLDTLRLDGAGSYDLSSFSITNIDSIVFNQNVAGFSLKVGDSQVSTADADGDGTQNDLRISASLSMTQGVTIDASGLTGTNHIIVDGSKLVGADKITGGPGDDVIDGGNGNDTLVGGEGNDTLSYASAPAGVSVNLSVTTTQETIGAGADTKSEFENLLGSSFADWLGGNDQGNVLTGLAGSDQYNGGTYYDGGGDNDLISFFLNAQFGATTGVTVDLRHPGYSAYPGVSNDGFGNQEIFFSIEDIRGSTLPDSISGSEIANHLMGEAGNDIIRGWGADDSLDGGDGDDTVNGGTGHDLLSGGNRADQFQFNSIVDGSNSDTVDDFNAAAGDTLLLSKLSFTALIGGAGDVLDESEFVSGPAATDPGQRIVYDQANGNLYYDTDGNGGGPEVLIAHFNGGPAITAGDILIGA